MQYERYGGSKHKASRRLRVMLLLRFEVCFAVRMAGRRRMIRWLRQTARETFGICERQRYREQNHDSG